MTETSVPNAVGQAVQNVEAAHAAVLAGTPAPGTPAPAAGTVVVTPATPTPGTPATTTHVDVQPDGVHVDTGTIAKP